MDVSLARATVADAEKLHRMQLAAFKPLLDKYQDFGTSPGAETLEHIMRRFEFAPVSHYFIALGGEDIGYIRINRKSEDTCRLSQMFILPEYQGHGYAQQAIKQAERLYPQVKRWELDTIKQEPKLCYLYEKLGYRLTGTGKHIKDGMDLVDYARQLL